MEKIRLVVFDGLPEKWAKNAKRGLRRLKSESTFWKGGTITFL